MSAPKAKGVSHYEEGRQHRPFDVIADWGLSYNLGSALAYIARIGRKAPDAGQTRAEKDIDDLMKVCAHVNDEIARLRSHAQPEVEPAKSTRVMLVDELDETQRGTTGFGPTGT